MLRPQAQHGVVSNTCRATPTATALAVSLPTPGKATEEIMATFSYLDYRLREDPLHQLRRAAYHIVSVIALLAFLVLIH